MSALPIATLTSMHTCPMVTPGTPPIPHVGGPIIGPGYVKWIIGALPISVVTDTATCVGPPDAIASGQLRIIAGVQPVSRITSKTVHGGAVTTTSGLPTHVA